MPANDSYRFRAGACHESAYESRHRGSGQQKHWAASGFVNVTHQIGGAIGLSLMVSTSEGISDCDMRFHHCMVIAAILVSLALAITIFIQSLNVTIAKEKKDRISH